jgi:hypothetical protein
MSLTYGYDLKDDDKILEASHRVIQLMTKLVLPGAALVNHFPFCAVFQFHPCRAGSASRLFSVRHIPSWVPFLSYEPLARTIRKLSERMRNEPIDFVKNALVCGDHALGIRVD